MRVSAHNQQANFRLERFSKFKRTLFYFASSCFLQVLSEGYPGGRAASASMTAGEAKLAIEPGRPIGQPGI